MSNDFLNFLKVLIYPNEAPITSPALFVSK
jgi:hypothetical protein